MSGCVEVDNLTWQPARRRTPALTELSVDIPAGQRVLLTGPSGAGKSTLLRAIAGLLLTADHGSIEGSVRVDGRPPADLAGRVGLMLQDPRSGIVAETVGRDVAFGPENRGLPRAEIWRRVTRALRETGFPYDAQHPTRELSGGEMQRLALAGSLAAGADVLLLDEPTAMLDPVAARIVCDVICTEVTRRATTLVVVAHHLEPWVGFCDRLVVLGPGGRIVADGSPTQVLSQRDDMLARYGVWAPGVPPPPVAPLPAVVVGPWEPTPRWVTRGEGAGLAWSPTALRERRQPRAAVADIDAELLAGSPLGVTGPSGAGKSTLVGLLAGLVRPTRGRVVAHPALSPGWGFRFRGGSPDPWRWRARDLARVLSWVPQLPEQGITRATVREEVWTSPLATGRDLRRAGERVDALLDLLGLADLAGANPYHLSGGEQRRLMVAAALAHGPQAVVLDEPTVGQDRHTWAAVMSAVTGASDAGAALAVATHDDAALTASGGRRLHLVAGRAA